MKKILYKEENGKVAVISPARDITLDDALKYVPVGREYLVIEEEQLPTAENMLQFFDALDADFDTPSAPNVRINIEGAKEITKQRLRLERAPLFEKNDIAIRDAMIENDTTKLAKAKLERDRLRDITKRVESLNNLDSLKRLHP
jgi:hypothetical protein